MISHDLIRILTPLLAAICVLGILITLLYSLVTHRSVGQKRFEHIAAQDTSAKRPATSDEINRKRDIEVTLRELEEKQKAKRGSKPSLLGRMRQAGLGWSKQTYYIACCIAALASFLGALAAAGVNVLPALGFGAAGGLLLPHLYVNFKRNKRFKKFSTEFPNAVDIIVRGVKAGLPLGDCLRIISLEAQDPVRSEFKIIVEDQTLGIPMDQAVQRLPERIPLTEANFFAIVIALQSRTGGSLSDALGNLSKVLRERKKMQGKIKAMSSEAKASAGIIGSLPLVVSLLLYLTSPHYIELMFVTFIGKIVLVACLLWMSIGILVMRKMINFDF
jgi:tight adherence protein B